MKKYKNMDEFFNEPVPQHISDQVDFEVQVVVKFVEFGEWLLQEYTVYVDNNGLRIWKDNNDNEFETEYLFSIWNSKE